MFHIKNVSAGGEWRVADIQRDHAFHIFNPDYAQSRLEMIGTEWGIEYIDGTMEVAEREGRRGLPRSS